MKGNRLLLLAGAVALVVALAVPAFALAAVWKDKGVNVSKHIEFKMSGGEIFEASAGNGMNCEIEATLTTEGGSDGKITTFDIKSCPKKFGTFSGCSISTAEGKGLPWTVDVNATDLTVTGWRTKRTFTGGCSELDKTISSMTVTLESPSEISAMNFLGETGTYKTGGTLNVLSPNIGTYGIG
jgi:hypothetical protein